MIHPSDLQSVSDLISHLLPIGHVLQLLQKIDFDQLDTKANIDIK